VSEWLPQKEQSVKYPDKGIEKRKAIRLFCFNNAIVEIVDKKHSQ
jgi:hypothetical protein